MVGGRFYGFEHFVHRIFQHIVCVTEWCAAMHQQRACDCSAVQVNVVSACAVSKPCGSVECSVYAAIYSTDSVEITIDDQYAIVNVRNVFIRL